MNTQTHILIGWMLARGWRDRRQANVVVSMSSDATPLAALYAAGILGGLFPDLSMVLLITVETMNGLSLSQIFNEAYFSEPWVSVDAVFNSIPLYLGVGIAGWGIKRPWLMLFGAAAALHCILDLPVHASDAHPHFWPLTMWTFESPLSYWESGKGAGWITLVELCFGAIGCWWLWRRVRGVGWRVGLGGIVAVYVLFAGVGAWFALRGWPS